MTSFIICSIDPVKFRFITMAIAQRMAGRPHEIIGIHDARSMCEGYNRGIARAVGEHLVFCHDDIDILSPDFSDRLAIGLAAYDIVGVAGTDRLVDSCGPAPVRRTCSGTSSHSVPDEDMLLVDQYGVPASHHPEHPGAGRGVHRGAAVGPGEGAIRRGDVSTTVTSTTSTSPSARTWPGFGWRSAATSSSSTPPSARSTSNGRRMHSCSCISTARAWRSARSGTSSI